MTREIFSSEPLESRTMLSAGDLDLSFGTRGTISITPPGGTYFDGDVVTKQPDGKYLVAASVTTAENKSRLELIRLMPDGKLDSYFGDNGVVILSPTAYSDISRPLTTGSGKILEYVSGNLVRFTNNGQLDKTFGVGGIVKNVGSGQMVLLKDGGFLAARGQTLKRYRADGSLDKSFGHLGTASAGFSFDDLDPAPPLSANDLDVESDGKILLTIQIGSGDTTGSITDGIVRFNSNGTLDTRFGSDGEASSEPDEQDNIPIATVITRDGGSVTLMSNENGGSWLVKLTSNGKFDPRFGTAGIQAVGVFDENDPETAFGTALLLRRDGGFTATFDLDLPSAKGIAQFNSDGSLDSGFNGTGKLFIPGRYMSDATLGGYEDVIFTALPEDSNSLDITAVQTQPRVRPIVTLSKTGRLTVNGTSNADSIQIQENSNYYSFVTVNNKQAGFFSADVTSIVVNGGAGNDTIILTSSINKPIMLLGGPGKDTVDFSAFTSDLKITLDNLPNDGPAGAKMNVESDIENVIGGSGNDLIIGNPSFNHLYGGPGNDTLYGGSGNDTVEGGHGHDQLFGQSGDDLLIARDGRYDMLDGGDGFDKASIDDSAVAKDQTLNVETFIG